jgi:thiosulfate dehydrogenase
MSRTSKVLLVALPCLVLGGVAIARSGSQAPQHQLPESKDGNIVVGLCDGKTAAEIPGVKQGETPTREQAQAVSDALMAEWRRKNPGARWEDPPVAVAQAETGAPAGGAANGGAATGGEAPAPAAQPPAPRVPAVAAPETQEGHTYGAFTDRDQQIWQAATDRFVAEGKRIFHSADLLGGTIGVSCDMCHPDAANTHPETYPKFQVQFGRVALLRDMINWCIENPVRGKPLHDDDDRLKALEAYIIASRKGVALDYGKH